MATKRSRSPSTPDPVRVAIIGAGSRGSGYARYALDHPEAMTVAGVANNDPSLIMTNADESIKSHLLVFDLQDSLKTPT